MDVPADFQIMAFLFNQLGFEPTLEEVSRPSMPQVEVPGVTAVQEVHAGGKVGLGRFHEEVFMIRQKGERMESPAAGRDGALEPVETPLSVGIVPDDVPPLIAPRHHMIQPTGQFNAQRSCHGSESTRFPSTLQA